MKKLKSIENVININPDLNSFSIEYRGSCKGIASCLVQDFIFETDTAQVVFESRNCVDASYNLTFDEENIDGRLEYMAASINKKDENGEWKTFMSNHEGENKISPIEFINSICCVLTDKNVKLVNVFATGDFVENDGTPFTPESYVKLDHVRIKIFTHCTNRDSNQSLSSSVNVQCNLDFWAGKCIKEIFAFN